MTLRFEELMNVNLKGYKYCIRSMGMTMTSRHGYITEYFIVLEDDGQNCIVAEFDNRSKTKTYPKEDIALLIENDPLVEWDDITKSSINSIEKI